MKPSPITKKYLFAVARQELDEWRPSINRGIVMAILFCFVHRVIEGKSIEETMSSWKKPTENDYQI